MVRGRGITQSMRCAGCAYDNAPKERYYNTLKAELVNRYDLSTDEELDHAVRAFAQLWYNQIRTHSFNHYMTLFKKHGMDDKIRRSVYKRDHSIK